MGQKHSSEKYKFDVKKNVYGEKLNKCRQNNSDSNGSWHLNGKCDEQSGGVHQICVSNLKSNFSRETSQSKWSVERANKPHCVCLGAYALYSKKNNDLELDCSAIPETVFDRKYIDKWNKWNGYEIDGQGSAGIKKLYKFCYKTADDRRKKEYIKNLYNNVKYW